MRQMLAAGTGDAVYSVASTAATLLQSMGEYCLVACRRPDANTAVKNALHAIGLNEIHLTALRAGVLVRWMAAMEIRSQNELTAFGFAKDYDAIVTVRMDKGERRFALEYDRTPKAGKFYRAIASSMSQEVHVNRLLYLVANYDLLRLVSGFFTNADFPVFFGLLQDWHAHMLEMSVLDHARRTFPLRQALNGSTGKSENIATATSYTLPFD